MPDPVPLRFRSLKAARAAAAGCRACPLWKNATQTVFGAGPARAPLMLVGEQPGDREDIEGRPFVGPAGQLLRRAMAEAGIDPAAAYITNAVKHFKFQQSGKRRLHKKPAMPEIRACKPWLEQELTFVQPRVVVLLGATAVLAVLGPGKTIAALRRQLTPLTETASVVVTVHPSSLLRIPDRDARAKAYGDFVKDLAFIAARLAAA